MPLKYANGKPYIDGIPRKSTLCISSLPSRREVINTRANGSFTPSELDPGKYVYCVAKTPLFNNPNRVWVERGEFLVDVNEDEYQRLLFIHPRYAKGVMTTQGARWDCGIANCSESFTSVIAAVQHEGEHLGIDFLHTTPDEAEEALIKAQRGSQMQAKDPAVNVRRDAGVMSAEFIDRAEDQIRDQTLASSDPALGLRSMTEQTARPTAKP